MWRRGTGLVGGKTRGQERCGSSGNHTHQIFSLLKIYLLLYSPWAYNSKSSGIRGLKTSCLHWDCSPPKQTNKHAVSSAAGTIYKAAKSMCSKWCSQKRGSGILFVSYLLLLWACSRYSEFEKKQKIAIQPLAWAFVSWFQELNPVRLTQYNLQSLLFSLSDVYLAWALFYHYSVGARLLGAYGAIHLLDKCPHS